MFTRTSCRAPSPISIGMQGSRVGSGRPLLLQGCTGPSLPNQLRGGGEGLVGYFSPPHFQLWFKIKIGFIIHWAHKG